MNTIDKYGDELTAGKIIDGSIDEFVDSNITKVGAAAFEYCFELVNVDLPLVSFCSNNAFFGCRNLISLNFPSLEEIDVRVFSACKNLESVIFPSVTAIRSYAFAYCEKLKTAVFQKAVAMNTYAFVGCSSLESVYLLGSFVGQAYESGIFADTPMHNSSYLDRYGSIFVRASLLSDYQSATNWAYYSERFVGLTDEQIAALDNE